MDGDLYIDYEMLDRTARNLAQITELMREPGDTIEEMGTREAGVQQLSDRLGEFNDEWSYGIRKIGQFSEGAAEALQGITEAWSSYDLSLADALQSAREGS